MRRSKETRIGTHPYLLLTSRKTFSHSRKCKSIGNIRRPKVSFMFWPDLRGPTRVRRRFLKSLLPFMLCVSWNSNYAWPPKRPKGDICQHIEDLRTDVLLEQVQRRSNLREFQEIRNVIAWCLIKERQTRRPERFVYFEGQRKGSATRHNPMQERQVAREKASVEFSGCRNR